jgi:hypothetical protein
LLKKLAEFRYLFLFKYTQKPYAKFSGGKNTKTTTILKHFLPFRRCIGPCDRSAQADFLLFPALQSGRYSLFLS